MGTLEARVDETLRRLEDDEEAKAEFLLDSLDFIREYTAAQVAESSNKRDILRRFLIDIEGHDELRTFERCVATEYVCDRCDAGMIDNTATQACFVCPDCGMCKEIVTSLMAYEKTSSRKITKQANYRRSNHLNDWLNTLMGRESTIVPEDILQAVRAELKKARISNTSDITPQLVYTYLKKLKLSKWYQHKHIICAALNGTPPPVMTPELENTIRDMFAQTEAPFERHVKEVIPNRRNMIYYGYLLYKYFELLGHDEFLCYLNLPRCHQKLHAMDVVWKRICDELNWQFIPTI